MPLKHDAAAIV